MPTPTVRFALGMLVATPGALRTMAEHDVDPLSIVARHVSGDWGDLGAHDKRENEKAVRAGMRILSCYGEDNDRLWIITEADRSVTTILRPDEY